MAIRQVGGSPVYTIEVDVPKVTDARGRSYGNLVSDLRWKLWEEVQNSQLQQMKFEEMSKQAQLDVLEQRQRDISRSIRDANEMKAEIKAGKTGPGGSTASTWLSYLKSQQSKTVTRTEPARDPFTGEIITGQEVKITTKTEPDKFDFSRADLLLGTNPKAERDRLAAEQRQFEERQASLDKYIADLEAEQSALGQKFESFASGLAQGEDLLSRTRDAFQTQIGEGGFGISRRPLRQLPRFDEQQAVNAVNSVEQSYVQEALRRKSQNARQKIIDFENLGG